MQGEAIPVRSARYDEIRRIVRRRFQQGAPAEARVDDDRHAERISDREHFLFGAAVGGVVADHEEVDQAAARDVSRKRALVARQAEQPHPAVALSGPAVFERAAGADDLFPLGHVLHIVKSEHIDVIGVQLAQDMIQVAVRGGRHVMVARPLVAQRFLNEDHVRRRAQREDLARRGDADQQSAA